ncbi:Interleukin-1 receptor-associated kinase 4 [Bulinus truncatus]|nr:Interleukin-1 receptor-associated kinase 4 [Bulinus truncatus]
MPYNVLLHLSTLLDIGNLWERLACVIPVKPADLFTDTGDYALRYNYAQIQNLAMRNQQRGKSCTRALLVDWGTQNITVKHLIEVLKRANLIAASEYMQQLIPSKQPSQTVSPSQPSSEDALSRCSNVSIVSSNASDFNVRIDHELYQNNHCENVQTRRVSITSMAKPDEGDSGPSHNVNQYEDDNVEIPDKETDDDVLLMKDVKFDVLKKITNNFDDRTVKDGGNLIGSGGFGTVFLGTFNTGFQVAVKRLNDSDDSQSQFKTELETLCKYIHENLVLLLGYSVEGRNRCLIYQYMCNGSLEDRLACSFDTPPLLNNLRFKIAKGTAKGIAYLHEGKLTHRDIKSANILLDSNFNPKVGDFATARVLPQGAATVTMKASVVIGTHSYLAPEAFSFVIHPALDCFSYGVVLLEILTGLPVIDHSRENPDLKIHVQEFCAKDDDGQAEGTIHNLLDQKGGSWDTTVVDTLYSISCRCLEESKPKRPKMESILAELEALTIDDTES